MAFYKTCSRCGANLDPGEKCDCENENAMGQERNQNLSSRHLKTEAESRQLTYVLEGWEDIHEEKICI